MPETSVSLFERLRIAPQNEDWARLVALYSPLIRAWLGRYGLPRQEVDDLTQEVMAVLVRRLPEFERQPRTGAFRRWLRSITYNCLRDHWREDKQRPGAVGGSDMLTVLDALADPESELSRSWDQEHDRHVSQQLLKLIKPNFSESTWQAFQRFAIDGLTAEAVAAELGTTVNAVFIAKSRVLSRLRQEAEGLLD
jgi:RNA polymerase sigma-70 factor (ECF subfamily)